MDQAKCQNSFLYNGPSFVFASEATENLFLFFGLSGTILFILLS
ncbi:hypothetical protein BSM4216_1701 [Bacillus smithii]|nr:hypothetical protein BSM4216_1701 [Bacillus smithii]